MERSDHIASQKRRDHFLYRIIKGLVRLLTPQMELTGAEYIPDGPAIIVASYCQLHGPIACALPEHTVVPYRNIPKKDYPSNIPAKEAAYEKTGS